MITFEGDVRVSDYMQWCDNGFVFYRLRPSDPPDSEIGQVIRFPEEEHDDKFVIHNINGQEDAIKDIAFRDAVFCHWPACGVVNAEGRKVAVYVRRRQTHQYCRTYNSEGVQCTIPGNYVLRRQGFNFPGTLWANPEVVKALFRPQYYSIQDAAFMIKNGEWWSVAVTPRFTLVKMPTGYPRLFHLDEYVGSYNPEKDTIQPRSAKFQKLIDRHFREVV